MNDTIISQVKQLLKSYNARLRGWQRITPNPNTTTATTAAQWDWKRHALAVPLEAFVKLQLLAALLGQIL